MARENCKWRRPGEYYHVIHGADVICCHTYMYSHAMEKMVLYYLQV